MTDARNIMAPHGEQDGWVYVRVKKWAILPASGRFQFFRQPGSFPCDRCGTPSSWPGALCGFNYCDRDFPNARIISSRRVEGDVETGDFLRVCANEALDALHTGHGWLVTPLDLNYNVTLGEMIDAGEYAPTLRVAYFRYKAAHHD